MAQCTNPYAEQASMMAVLAAVGSLVGGLSSAIATGGDPQIVVGVTIVSSVLSAAVSPLVIRAAEAAKTHLPSCPRFFRSAVAEPTEGTPLRVINSDQAEIGYEEGVITYYVNQANP